MTRASACLGLLLAAVCVAGGLAVGEGGTPVSPLEAGAGAVVLGVFGVLTWRRRRWAQVVLSLTGLALLGRFLPVYFQTTQMWPYLAVIVLGSGTFGIGILGVLIDGFESRDLR